MCINEFVQIFSFQLVDKLFTTTLQFEEKYETFFFDNLQKHFNVNDLPQCGNR